LLHVCTQLLSPTDIHTNTDIDTDTDVDIDTDTDIDTDIYTGTDSARMSVMSLWDVNLRTRFIACTYTTSLVTPTDIDTNTNIDKDTDIDIVTDTDIDTHIYTGTDSARMSVMSLWDVNLRTRFITRMYTRIITHRHRHQYRYRHRHRH